MGNSGSNSRVQGGVAFEHPNIPENGTDHRPRQPYSPAPAPPILEVVMESTITPLEDSTAVPPAVPVTPDSHAAAASMMDDPHEKNQNHSRRRFRLIARLVQSSNNNQAGRPHRAVRQQSIRENVFNAFPAHRHKSTQRHTSLMQCKRIAQKLVNEFQEPWYQETLQRLKDNYRESEFEDDPGAWAHHMYATLRDANTANHALKNSRTQQQLANNSSNNKTRRQSVQQQQQQAEVYRRLNLDRRTCMQLLHDLCKEWKDQDYCEDFELALNQVFTRHNLLELLRYCLPLERARALVYTQHGRYYGIPWYSSLHLTNAQMKRPELELHEHAFVLKHEVEQQQFEIELRAYVTQQQSNNPTSPGGASTVPPLDPPMSDSLFLLLYSDVLNLQTNRYLKEWSLPAMPHADVLTREFSNLSSSTGSSYCREMEESRQQMMQVVQSFVSKYDSSHYQDALHRLDVDFLRSASPGADEWAKEIYTTLRRDKSDGRAAALNHARCDCLRLLYDLAEEWEDRKYGSSFEDVLAKVFRPSRLLRILRLCLPLDRAHALYKMRRPWVSELHLEEGTSFATDHPTEFQECRDMMAALMTSNNHNHGGARSRSGGGGTGGVVPTTMKKDLFRILFSNKFGLQDNTDFQKWSMPALPGGHSRPGLVSEDSLASRGVAQSRFSKGTIDSNAVDSNASERDLMPAAEDVPLEQLSKHKQSVRVFVRKYDEPDYREALEHLEADFLQSGSPSIEEWAKDLYTKFREDPDNVRAKGVNTDRRQCLDLIYNLVREWEENDYSSSYEQAIEDTFKVRRLVRVLSYCLPLDRAQALYKMQHEGRIGLPWYCKLHLEPNTSFARDYPNEQRLLMERVENYTGFPPMNKKLFRLLFSDRLGLQSKNADFRKWSMPYTPRKDNSDPTGHRNKRNM